MSEIDTIQFTYKQMEALIYLRNYFKKAINSLIEFIKKYCSDNNMTIQEFHDLIISKELQA